MAEILLVNPRFRTGVAKVAKRRKHRMPAALRKYWASHRRNPHRRHHKRHRHHYRRNPFSVGNAKNVAMSTVGGGAIGAIGATANDFLYTYTAQYLPATLTASGYGVAAAKVLYAIIIGMFGGKIWAGKGEALAVGAATVALHDLAIGSLQSAGINLSGIGGMGAYMSYAPAVGRSSMAGLGSSQGKSVVRQLQRRTMGNLGAYMSRQGMKVPQRGMGAYMSGFGDTTFANGIPTG